MSAPDPERSARSKLATYTFEPVASCNMCGAESADAKVIGRRLNRPQGLRPRARVGVAVTVVRCGGCNLVYANPMPVPSGLDQHYDVPPDEYWNAASLTQCPVYFRDQIETFLRLHPSDGRRALDIGSGVGHGFQALVRAGFDVWGIEPSRPFRATALESGVISADRLQLSSIESADFPSGSYDFVTFGAVLEHLRNPSAAILKAMTWLRPNGLVHAEVPSSAWLTHRIVNRLYRLQGLDYAANLSPMHAPFHLYEFSQRSFAEHAARHGYELAEHRVWVGETFLPPVLDPLIKPLMARTGTGLQLEVWLRKRDEGTPGSLS